MPSATVHTKREEEHEANPLFGKFDRDVYTPEMVSVRLGVSKNTVFNAIRRGELNSRSLSATGPTRVTRRAVMAWLEGRRLPAVVGDAENPHTLSEEAEP